MHSIYSASSGCTACAVSGLDRSGHCAVERAAWDGHGGIGDQLSSAHVICAWDTANQQPPATANWPRAVHVTHARQGLRRVVDRPTLAHVTRVWGVAATLNSRGVHR